MLKLPPFAIAGVDYGSKLAGTTVIAVLLAGEINFFSSRKGEDADIFLAGLIEKFALQKVFIDAPLSLPGVYSGVPGCTDYFYRKADRQLRAMSPMFLGGLTARAIQLKNKLLPSKVQFLETYPSGWVKICATEAVGYRSKEVTVEVFCQNNVEIYPLVTRSFEIISWHHADALIALMSGLRYENEVHMIYGKPEEGEIVI
jgi:predicted nuclease with RNAse H fold